MGEIGKSVIWKVNVLTIRGFSSYVDTIVFTRYLEDRFFINTAEASKIQHSVHLQTEQDSLWLKMENKSECQSNLITKRSGE